MIRTELKNVKRIVIKIGTSSLTDKTGLISKKHINSFVNQISKLQKQGKEIILVTSGAVGVGIGELGLNLYPQALPLKQTCAAVGQIELMHQYRIAFAKNNIHIAQILLNYSDFSTRETYLNLRTVMNTILSEKIIPIVNENDSVATDELTFGDNDKLSSLVASKLEADLLIMVSTVDGLLDKRKGKENKRITIVEEINDEIKQMCRFEKSHFGKGSMLSKIEVAETVMSFGCSMLIINGIVENSIIDCFEKDIGTIFIPKTTDIIKNRQRWIQFSKSEGEIIIDEGAKNAILKGNSLLPKGIIDVKGHFPVGGVININCGKELFAYAIVDYNSSDIARIKGKHSKEIEGILGRKTYDTVAKSYNIVLKHT